MARPFRFASPVVTTGTIARPRLLERLAARWETRVVVVTAGTGFGKTTLLACAAEENALHPHGVDVWLGCEPIDDTGDTLTRDLGIALGLSGDGQPSVPDLADAIARRSPDQVALLLDDVHEIAAGSLGAAVLAELLAELPANGHLVLAGREAPPVGVARLEAQGQVARLGEDDLQFTVAELETIAADRRVDPGVLADVGGWPALVELTAASGHGAVSTFLMEEIVGGLDRERRRDFAALVAIGGGDAELASAAAGHPVDLESLVDGIPLVAWRSGSAARPHSLWEDALTRELAVDEIADVRRRAAAVLHRRGDLAGAVELLASSEEHPAIRAIVVEACTAGRALVGDGVLARWRDLLTRDAAAGAERLLVSGLLLRVDDPWSEQAKRALTEAASRFRACDEHHGEVACLAHLGYLAWHANDADALLTVLARMGELEARDDAAAMFVTIGRALAAHLSGRFAVALAELDGLPRGRLTEEWDAAAMSLRSLMLLLVGRAEEAVVDGDRSGGGLLEGSKADGFYARWHAGRPEDVLAAIPLPGHASPNPYDRLLARALEVIATAHAGRVDEASRALALIAGGPAHDGTLGGVLGLVRALVTLAAGDEDAAGAQVGAVLAESPVVAGPTEPLLRRFLPLLYVLAPETRPFWDAQPYEGCWAETRAVGASLVAARAGSLSTWPAVEPGRVLTSLPLPWSVELGVAGAAAGFGAAEELLAWLLDRFGAVARDAVRGWSVGSDRGAERARHALAAVPVAPTGILTLSVLGPAELRRDGVLVSDAAWSRERVRHLLLHLVAHRRISRAAVAAALWPDLEESRAANNLRTNLSHLLGVLEPDRRSGDASFFIRQHGATLVLHHGDRLVVDAWDLDRLLDAAEEAERQRAPSVALATLLEALDLWRGEYLYDAREEDWAVPLRQHAAARLHRAGIRAAELLLAAGRAGEAVDLGERVVAAEPWSEAAHRVVMAALLDAGDRGAARRALERCRVALEEMDVHPEPATTAVIRRVLAGRG